MRQHEKLVAPWQQLSKSHNRLDCPNKNCLVQHWNGNVVILTKTSSLVAPNAVKMTASAASDWNIHQNYSISNSINGPLYIYQWKLQFSLHHTMQIMCNALEKSVGRGGVGWWAFGEIHCSASNECNDEIFCQNRFVKPYISKGNAMIYSGEMCPTGTIFGVYAAVTIND